MLLKLKIVKIALHKLLMISIESEVDDGGELPEDFNSSLKLTDKIIAEQGETAMFIMGKMIGEISNAWKVDVGLVFYHMGIIDDVDQAGDTLYRLIMSCFGHGISISLDEEFDKAMDILKSEHDVSPVSFDQHEMFVSELVEPELVYMLDIEYECPECGHKWSEQYESACDSECPECGLGDIQALSWERVQ